MAYQISLSSPLGNLHDVFQVSLLRRYIPDSFCVVQVDDLLVRDDLTVGITFIQIEDREVKKLRGNEFTLVKVVWGGPTGGGKTRECEEKKRESYPTIFSSSNFKRENYLSGREL